MGDGRWDDDFNCTTCTTPHPVINKWTGLVLAVTDQHFPAYLPPCDGRCMAIVRHSNLGMTDLCNHTILPIHNQAKKATSLDTHGPLALLQKAILERKPVILFYTSGTGLTSEGPSGTTLAMQRILGLSQSIVLKDGETPIIRHVIFPQPLTHFTDAPMQGA